MRIVHMPSGPKRTFRIAVDIGQYHFVDWRGWRIEWDTRSPREWWQKQLWLKDGGWKQDPTYIAR